MAINYTQKEIQKLFESLPEELKETILSEETAETIRGICERHSVSDKVIPEVARLVGEILIGLLPPENLPRVMEKNLGIDKEKADSVSREINRFILFPVKDSLAEFYQEIKFAPGGRIEIKKEETETLLKKPLETEKKEEYKEDKEKRTMTDVYREPVD